MTLSEATNRLAQWHLLLSAQRVFIIISDDPEPVIYMLIVAEDTKEVGIQPLGFPANQTIPYKQIIAEVSPRELQWILDGLLPLPSGWKLGEEIYSEEPYV